MGEIGLEHVCRPGKVKTIFSRSSESGWIIHHEPIALSLPQEVVALCIISAVDVELHRYFKDLRIGQEFGKTKFTGALF